MTRYQDLELLPDVELPIFFIRNKVYTKLHKAIFDLNASDIGVSFPQAKERLGCVIRIHSTKDRLNELQKLNWLGGLAGYCQVGILRLVRVLNLDNGSFSYLASINTTHKSQTFFA
jgi:CRISPR-associated endonuclease Csy4